MDTKWVDSSPQERWCRPLCMAISWAILLTWGQRLAHGLACEPPSRPSRPQSHCKTYWLALGLPGWHSRVHLCFQADLCRDLMNSMYSHQGRSQGWANRVSEERSGWYAQKLVGQADTTVSEKELLLQRRELTWYHSEWEGTVGSGRTSYTIHLSAIVLHNTIACECPRLNKKERV